VDSRPVPSIFMDESREADLLRAARGGDREAYADLIRHYQRPLYRLSFALTRNHDDAVALAVESFRRARAELARLPDGKPFAPWLFRITRSLSIARARSRVIPTRPRTTSTGQSVEPEQRILDAWEELRPDEQMALALRVAERLSYSDIATLLDHSAGVTLARVSSARGYLLSHKRDGSEEAQ
jgi:RNA polymerase sigma-70 factor (ECF subfamily)